MHDAGSGGCTADPDTAGAGALPTSAAAAQADTPFAACRIAPGWQVASWADHRRLAGGPAPWLVRLQQLDPGYVAAARRQMTWNGGVAQRTFAVALVALWCVALSLLVGGPVALVTPACLPAAVLAPLLVARLGRDRQIEKAGVSLRARFVRPELRCDDGQRRWAAAVVDAAGAGDALVPAVVATAGAAVARSRTVGDLDRALAHLDRGATPAQVSALHTWVDTRLGDWQSDLRTTLHRRIERVATVGDVDTLQQSLGRLVTVDDRRRAEQVLADALVDGRLTVEEHHQRLEQLAAASAAGELDLVLDGLRELRPGAGATR
jgi:hypothetical protein